MDNFMDKLAQKFNAQEMIKANSEAETNEMKKMKLQISEYEKILQEMRKLNYKNTEISEKLDLMIGENADKIQTIKEDGQKLVYLLRDIANEQTKNIESDMELRREDKAQRESYRSELEKEKQERRAQMENEKSERERERQERRAQMEDEKSERQKERQERLEELEQERLERQEEKEKERQERQREIQANRQDNKLVIDNLTQFIDSKFQSSDDFAHKENVKVYRNVQAVVVDELKRYNDSVQEEHESLQRRVTAATWVGAIAAVASICNIVIWVIMILMNSGL